MPHLYAAPENAAELKPLGNQRFQSLTVNCGPEGNAGTGVPPHKDTEPATYKAEGGGPE